MGRAGWVLVGLLTALLALAVVFAVRAWNSTGAATGGGEITLNGGIALVLGAVGTIVLGAGLMALVFLSNRSGHDEVVHREYQNRVPDPDDGPGST